MLHIKATAVLDTSRLGPEKRNWTKSFLTRTPQSPYHGLCNYWLFPENAGNLRRKEIEVRFTVPIEAGQTSGELSLSWNRGSGANSLPSPPEWPAFGGSRE